MRSGLFIFLLANAIDISWFENVKENISKKQGKPSPRSVKLPACQACRILVESFLIEDHETTQKIDEDRHKMFPDNSKIFEEFFSMLCHEDRAKDQCKSLAEKSKEDLKFWWLRLKNDTPDLFHFLCIEKLRYCCPNGHYGPECHPCPGYPGRVCNNNGKCKGNGTRKGNGDCSCDVGYSGKSCDQCAPSYYVSYRDDNKMLCSRCHSACDGNCSQAGAKGCELCREGWKKDKLRGCVDINECLNKRPPCKRNEFCVNNEGSYSCLACDPSCDTCSGDGPDMCEKCAAGFVLKDNICVNEKQYVSYSDITRYITYAGLCFATYIIFQNNPWPASAIGLCVAMYVTVSEYMLGTLSAASLSRILEGLESLWRDV